MRTRKISACHRFSRAGRRPIRRAAVVLQIAAAVCTIFASPAAARPGQWVVHGIGAGAHAATRREHRYESSREDAQPRRRARAGVARRRQTGTRTHMRLSTRTHVARRHPRRHTARRNGRRSIAAAVRQPVPVAQRSIVAAHPLTADPLFDTSVSLAALQSDLLSGSQSGAAAPRCRSAHRSTFALAVAGFDRAHKAWEPAFVEGARPHCRGARHPQSNWQLASLGPSLPAPTPSAGPSLSGGSIRWIASSACLASPLRTILGQVAAAFGPVTVNSTCRSPGHNRRVGGAPRSYHLTGHAVDFRIRGSYGPVLAFLDRLRSVGGLKHYGSGVFHIDTGPRRTWGTRRGRLSRRG